MRELKFNLEVESNALLCPNPTEWYSKAYLTPNVVDDFRVIPGVKYKTKIANNTFDSLIQPENCAWVATDSLLDAVDIEVTSISAMAQICQYDIEKSFVSLEMAAGNGNYEVASFMSHYFEEMSSEIESEIQDIRWNGNTGLTSSYLKEVDGYLVKLSGTIGITGSAITTGNIVDTLKALTTALPEKVKNKKADIRIYMSASNALKYSIATLALNNNFNYTGELPLFFAGYKISVQEGMDDAYIVIGSKNNFIYAFDGENDSKDIKAVNLIDTVAEPIIRTRVGLKLGFYLLNKTEIAHYKAV